MLARSLDWAPNGSRNALKTGQILPIVYGSLWTPQTVLAPGVAWPPRRLARHGVR